MRTLTPSQTRTCWCELADPGLEAAAQVCSTPNLASSRPNQLRHVAGVLSKPRGVEVVKLDLCCCDDSGGISKSVVQVQLQQVCVGLVSSKAWATSWRLAVL